MRFIVYGVGAVGGTIAAALARSGADVLGIARGAQLEALQANGLLFQTPGFTERVSFPSVGRPQDIDFTPEDVIILTMKSQHTADALLDLRDAGVTDQAVMCAQNGVANERMALRYFPGTCGITVMLPADYVVPGEVCAFGTPTHGVFEIGCYPGGIDARVDATCAALNKAGFAAFASDAVMQSKHGKLLHNLANVVEAALGADADRSTFQSRLRDEALAVYAVAGIPWRDASTESESRRSLMQLGEIAGVVRTGGSSTQSLKRGAGSIETDYLNGEIVLLARLHGVQAPLNTALCRLGHRLLAEGRPPGSLTPAELDRLFAEAA